jgi:hypothetical protein
MVGETYLTDTQVAKILNSVPKDERDAIAPELSNPDVLPVAYKRTLFALETASDGTEQLVPVETVDADTVALGGMTAVVDPVTWNGLYATLTVVRDTTYTAGYRWSTQIYFKFTTGDGMHGGNCSEDSVALSWANSELASGNYYQSGTWVYPTGTKKPLDIYKSDGTPNQGVGWSFHEWAPDGGCNYFIRLNTGLAKASLTEPTFLGKDTNIVAKYFHTYPSSTTSYSLGFPGGGTINISPQTSVSSPTMIVTIRT